jgi:molybdopterin molybdotransferase
MLNILEAQNRLLSALKIVGKEGVQLSEADARVLADDLLAQSDSPLFSNSSMDGFAIRSQDLETLTENNQIQFEVVGDIPAGHTSKIVIAPGQSMRIMTGAPLPEGADLVIPVEETDVQSREADTPLPKRIKVFKSYSSGTFVRPKAEDYSMGEILIKAGKRLRAQEVALLAVNGQSNVSVYRKPRIALLSSGDELILPGKKLGAGQIYESNSFALASQIKSSGAETMDLGIASDDFENIKLRFEAAIKSDVDMIISSAGVSVGAYDYLRDVILSAGELDFWRVNMKPGKPLAFGSYKETPFIGLPGNPVSSFASFEVFGRPALKKLGGEKNWQRKVLDATLVEDLPASKRQSFLRGLYRREKEGNLVNLTGHQGSGNLYSLVQANCLILVPPSEKPIKAGATVEIWPL